MIVSRSEASLAWANADYPFSAFGSMPIKQVMLEQPDHTRKRIERVAFETDQLFIVGDVTLPPEGYQSRFSDSLNRNELEFLPLTNCEITSLLDGQSRRQDFMVLSKRHIRIAYPIDESPVEGPVG